MSKRLGMVLPGGGAKGAYQVGAFMALRDLGLAHMVNAVSGTSIGALNAVLWAHGDMAAAVSLWHSTSPEQFNRSGLEATLDRYLRPDLIAHAPYPIYATCLAGFPLGSVTYFKLNGRTVPEMRSILHATSAVPGLFEPVQIGGVAYSDGGIGVRSDNVPVRPLYEAGYSDMLVVHLDPTVRVDLRAYPGARLLEVRPSRSLGGVFTGNLDFRGEGARWRIELGYQDALAQLPALLGLPAGVAAPA